MKLRRRKFLHLGSGRYRPVFSLTLRLGAISSDECRRDRSGGDGATSNVAKHCLARSRSRSLQKARDRYDLPAIAVGGPEAAAGLTLGDLEFAHAGFVPVAEEVLKGRDIVILAMPTSDFPKSFVMTRKGITQLAQLAGKKVRVLTETGQTSVATRITIEKAGATAIYLPLAKFDRVYAALASGEIDAGRYRSICALPAKFAMAGTPSREFLRRALDIRYHSQVGHFQPRACDERHAGLR